MVIGEIARSSEAGHAGSIRRTIQSWFGNGIVSAGNGFVWPTRILRTQAIVKLAAHAGEFLLVTQNVDDLHLRAKSEGRQLSQEKVVQIHGDIFVTRCSRCEFQVGASRDEQRAEGMAIFRDAQSAAN